MSREETELSQIQRLKILKKAPNCFQFISQKDPIEKRAQGIRDRREKKNRNMKSVRVEILQGNETVKQPPKGGMEKSTEADHPSPMNHPEDQTHTP